MGLLLLSWVIQWARGSHGNITIITYTGTAWDFPCVESSRPVSGNPPGKSGRACCLPVDDALIQALLCQDAEESWVELPWRVLLQFRSISLHTEPPSERWLVLILIRTVIGWFQIIANQTSAKDTASSGTETGGSTIEEIIHSDKFAKTEFHYIFKNEDWLKNWTCTSDVIFQKWAHSA